jgi:hypothetical protein
MKTINNNNEIKNWESTYYYTGSTVCKVVYESGFIGEEDITDVLHNYAEPIIRIARGATELTYIRDEILLIVSPKGEYSVTMRIMEDGIALYKLYYEGNIEDDHSSKWLLLEDLTSYLA